MKKIGIYKITSPSGRIYIGQSIDIENRWNKYKRLNCKKQVRLLASLNFYGVENHTFEIIEECSIEILNERERYWQDLYDVTNKKTGLNCRLTATNDKTGEMSEETKQKLSKSSMGKKMSEEAKNNMRLAQLKLYENGYISPRKGVKASDEIKQKLSLSHKGRKAHNSKIVIDLETGFFYNSTKEAWEHNRDYLKVSQSMFIMKLNGKRKNNTKFNYI